MQIRMVAERVAERLGMIWLGQRDLFLRMTIVECKTRGSFNPSEQTVKRVRALIHKGELAKACLAAWAHADIRDVATTRDAFTAQNSSGGNEADPPEFSLQSMDTDLVNGSAFYDDIVEQLMASCAWRRGGPQHGSPAR